MSTEHRLATHIRLIRKFTQKVIVIVDPDTRTNAAHSREIHDRLTELGYDVYAHHCDYNDTASYSCIMYCEFNTEEEAALFKLTHL